MYFGRLMAGLQIHLTCFHTKTTPQCKKKTHQSIRCVWQCNKKKHKFVRFYSTWAGQNIARFPGISVEGRTLFCGWGGGWVFDRIVQRVRGENGDGRHIFVSAARGGTWAARRGGVALVFAC